VAVLGLVIAVESSSGLAGAYGVAVSTTMVITTVLAYVVMRRRWGWSMAKAGLVTSALLTMDGAFLAGNAAKILDGGWFPLAVGVIGYAVMSTWRRGRAGLVELTRKTSVSLDELLRSLKKTPPTQVDGTAVFLTADSEGIPSTLLHNLKHNKILHRLVIFLTFVTEEVPRIATQDRVRISIVGERFYRVTAHYGFMQSPHLPAILARCHAQGLAVDLDDVTVFVGRQVPFVQRPFRPWHWRMHLFAFLARNTASLVTALHVRPEWIVELGARVRL